MATRPLRATRVAFVCRKARQFRASFFFPREENILAGNEAAAVVTFSPPAIYYRSPDKSLQPIRFIWAYHPAGIFYQLPSYDPFTVFAMTHSPDDVDTWWSLPLQHFPLLRAPIQQVFKRSHDRPRFHIFILRRRCWCHGFTRLFIPKPTHTHTHTELGPC